MNVVKRTPTTFGDLRVGQLYMYGNRPGDVFIKLNHLRDKNEMQVVAGGLGEVGHIHFETASTAVVPVEITEVKEL